MASSDKFVFFAEVLDSEWADLPRGFGAPEGTPLDVAHATGASRTSLISQVSACFEPSAPECFVHWRAP